MTTQRLDLHIGVEKTGTTTIQRALHDARAGLLEHGVLYPTSPGAPNHVALAIVGRDDDVVDDLRRRKGLGTPADVEAFRQSTAAALRAEIAAADVGRVVLCGEHCSSRLGSDREVTRLIDWLRGVVDADLHVHCYLRRQDRLLESRHSTALRAGVARDLELPADLALPAFFHFDELLDRWARIVGEDHVHAHRFERTHLVDGDVVADVIHRLALPADVVGRPTEANQALDAATQRFMALLAEHVPRFVDGVPNPLHRRVVAAIDAIEPQGPPERLQPAERDRLLAAVADGNRAVARRWFGEDELFPPPEPADGPEPAPLGVERAVAIAAQVIRHVAGGS